MRQLLHQEYATSSFQLDTRITGRIGNIGRVKAAALIRDDELDAVGFFMAGHPDLFLLVVAVAMDHGIVDGLGQADEDIGIQILIDMQTLHHLLDKVFDFADATGVRGQF